MQPWLLDPPAGASTDPFYPEKRQNAQHVFQNAASSSSTTHSYSSRQQCGQSDPVSCARGNLLPTPDRKRLIACDYHSNPGQTHTPNGSVVADHPRPTQGSFTKRHKCDHGEGSRTPLSFADGAFQHTGTCHTPVTLAPLATNPQPPLQTTCTADPPLFGVSECSSDARSSVCDRRAETHTEPAPTRRSGCT